MAACSCNIICLVDTSRTGNNEKPQHPAAHKQQDVCHNKTQARAQSQVCVRRSRAFDDVCTQELEPVHEDTDVIDFRLQWVLGLMYDHDSFRGWNQSAVGEYSMSNNVLELWH